jgi:hypothetical protein
LCAAIKEQLSQYDEAIDYSTRAIQYIPHSSQTNIYLAKYYQQEQLPINHKFNPIDEIVKNEFVN